MSKYNIGDEINITGKIKITGIQTKLDGSTVYQIANIPAPELDKIAVPAKTNEAPKPVFVEGGYAKVTGRTNGHRFEIGEIVKLDHVTSTSKMEWKAYYLDGRDFWYVLESDMTPCEAPKAKAETPKAEPVKQEPVKLYCVKSYRPGTFLTKGKTYEYKDNKMAYDDGRINLYYNKNYDEFAREEFVLSACLCKLVRRPAKVGEWIYITKSCDSRAEIGKIYERADSNGCDLFIKHPQGMRCGDNAARITGSEYLVLDGYKPEPTEPPKQPEKPANLVDRAAKVGEKIYINKAEGTNGAYKNGDICEVVRENNAFIGDVYIKTPTGKTFPYNCSEGEGTAYVNRSEYLVVEEKPKLYNGKVICIEKGDKWYWTVGKTYQVINGIIKDDDGDTRLAFASLQELNSRFGNLKFIEAID